MRIETGAISGHSDTLSAIVALMRDVPDSPLVPTKNRSSVIQSHLITDGAANSPLRSAEFCQQSDLTTTVFDFDVGTYQYAVSQSAEGESDSRAVSAELSASSDLTKKNLNLSCIIDESSRSD